MRGVKVIRGECDGDAKGVMQVVMVREMLVTSGSVTTVAAVRDEVTGVAVAIVPMPRRCGFYDGMHWGTVTRRSLV